MGDGAGGYELSSVIGLPSLDYSNTGGTLN